MSESLYERTKKIFDLWERIDELEHGVSEDAGLTPEGAEALKALYAELGAAEGGFERKVEACAGAVRECELKAGMAKEEADRLYDRAQVFANRAKRIKTYVLNEMQAVGCPKVETELFTVAVRTNPAAVNVVAEDMIPQQYLTAVVTTKLDKKAIKAAIEAGTEVPGAELVRGTSLSIK